MRYSLLLLVVICLWPVFTQRHPQGDKDNTDGCAKEFLFFEFSTAAPVTQVIHSFKGLTVIYSFKVYGAGHYIFVVKNDQSQALNNLTLPDDACLTVSTFPVETFSTFFRRFGIDFPASPFERLTGRDLTFVEGIYVATGSNEDQFAASLSLQARPLLPMPNDLQTGFMAVAELQIRYFFFGILDDCTTAAAVFSTFDNGGSADRIKTRVLKLHEIGDSCLKN